MGCLESIRNDPPRVSHEIIAVFNGSPASDVQRVSASFPDVRAIRSRVNLGFAGGNNLAADHALGEYLVFLNDDTIPQAGWLDALVNTADRCPMVGAVGSRILFPDGTLQEAGSILWRDGTTSSVGRGEPKDSNAFSYGRRVDYCSANGLLVPAKAFQAVGRFDEAFFPAYYEDVDLCLAIQYRLKLDILYEPRSRIAHYEAASTEPSFRNFLFRRNVERIREKWASELAGYEIANPLSPAACDWAVQRARRSSGRLLVIDDRIPNSGLGSGFGRLEELVLDLAGTDYAVSFYPAVAADDDAAVLNDAGIELIGKPLLDHLAEAQYSYDAIVLSRPHNYEHFGESIRRLQPQAALIYDAEALFHRRLLLQAALEQTPEAKAARWEEAQQMLRLEQHIARACDRIVCISLDEKAILGEFKEHCPIELLPPLASNVVFGEEAFGDRAGLVFAAGWLAGDVSPNAPALEWFVGDVLPLILASCPNTVLHVTGKDPPVFVQRLAGPNVRFTGFVKQLSDLYAKTKVAVVPILYGAGVKIKTIEAMQFGVPVVATKVGAEGLGCVDGTALDIADSAEDFAARVIWLLTDESVWMSRRREIRSLLASLESARPHWDEIVGRAIAGGRRGGQSRTRSGQAARERSSAI